MLHPTFHRSALAMLLLLPFAAACGDSEAQPRSSRGDLELRIYGKSYTEVGISADNVSDGWDITFDRFEVELRSFTLAGETYPIDQTFDLSEDSQGEGQEALMLRLDPGEFGAPGYELGTIGVQGSAEKNGITKTFDWSFEGPVPYGSCNATFDIVRQESTVVELTIHAHLLFFNGTEHFLLFAPFADADTDGDDVITRAELEAADVGSLATPETQDLENLWEWLDYQSAQMGYIDGELACL